MQEIYRKFQLTKRDLLAGWPMLAYDQGLLQRFILHDREAIMRAWLTGFAIIILTGIAGCAGQAVEEAEPGVQDLQPGEKSVIQAPAPSAPARNTLEERAI